MDLFYFMLFDTFINQNVIKLWKSMILLLPIPYKIC